MIRTTSGVYSSESGSDKDLESQRTGKPFCLEGRPSAQDNDCKDRSGWARQGCKVVSTGYADIGFDVDIGPLFRLRVRLPGKQLRMMSMCWEFQVSLLPIKHLSPKC